MKHLLLTIFLILLMSGCVIPGTNIELPFNLGGKTDISDVVVIKQLNAYPEKIKSDQTIRFVAYIENRGKETVENVVVNLYDYCVGVFETPNAVCSGGESQATSCKIEKLYPKEIKEVYWILKPKSGIKLETPCTLKVSVTYPYKTTTLSTINFISEQEQRRLIETNAFRTKSSTQIRGEGPVKVNINVLEPQPIPVHEGGGGTTSITFEIINRGSGFLVQETKDEKQLYHLWVEDISYTNDNKGVCTFSDENGEQSLGKMNRQITLMRDRSSTITCDLEKPFVEKERTDNIIIVIRYEYEIRKEKKVTVLPKD